MKVDKTLISISLPKPNRKSSGNSLESSPIGQNLSDFILILTHTASIVHLLKSLTWHTTTHIRTSSRWQQRRVTQLIDSLLPSLGRLWRRIDALQSLSVNQIDSISDPTTLNLDRARSVGEQSWSVWPVEVEHVGVTTDGRSKVRICGSFPFVFEIGAVDALETHISHSSCCNVKSGGKCHDIDFVNFAIFGFDAGLCELDNLVTAFERDVDDINIISVEHFVIVLFKARAL